MGVNWVKTEDYRPQAGKIVLGYWPTVTVMSAVFHEAYGWLKAPGYVSEKLCPPDYWGEFPNLPDGIERGE